MKTDRKVRQVVDVVILLACAAAMTACQLELVNARPEQPGTEGATPAPQDEVGLVIINDSPLPETYPRGYYEVRFRAHGGVPVLHWRLEKGALPPGIKLEDDGLLHGQAERAGEFQFTVSVRDGGKPEQAVQKGFVLRVRSALTLNWKAPAHVNGNRIEGSVEVSNTTPDDMDLTFIVLAVAGNGRATAIGYQHFLLTRGTVAKELPFGETLPRGGYVVHADAVGEVLPKNLIYRERMRDAGGIAGRRRTVSDDTAVVWRDSCQNFNLPSSARDLSDAPISMRFAASAFLCLVFWAVPTNARRHRARRCNSGAPTGRWTNWRRILTST